MAQEGFITVQDGTRLFYRQLGQRGSAVIIPNGLYYMDAFATYAESFRLIFYDVRNRGYSDAVPSEKQRGIRQDVEDMDAVRAHFGLETFALIGHSYMGLGAGLYAAEYPSRVERLLQLSPMQPDSAKQYPAELTNNDTVAGELFSQIMALQQKEPLSDPVENCRRFWSVFGAIFVADPMHADRIDWGRCDSANERAFMKYWTEVLVPSIRAVQFDHATCSAMKNPVLIIHGRKDRNSPYGGALDWASLWPNARLLTLPNAAHAPWIEAPEVVMPAIGDFLAGRWPDSATSL